MPDPGTLIEGKYEILGKIREGGMGAIYKVRHRLLDEIRVIKVMQPQIGDNEEMKKRFVQEAKTVTKLKHTNIGTVLDFALDENGTAYIVMEFIDGVTLADVFKTAGPPDIPLALEVTHQTLLALSYLHRRSVVHRDIAPDNLMLTRDEDGNPRVKVIDLGIAKALDKTVEITSTGVFLGKVKYCSPEQLGGLPKGETLDGRSDLYSLGAVLYEMLTGQRPFKGETPRELFAAHLFIPPLSFAESDPSGRIPEPVRAAVLKALEKKREDRFASAEEFDREILRLKPQIGDVDHADATMKMILSARATPLSAVASVTPSAQDRLDHQFRAQSTPTPITAGLPAVPLSSRSSSTANDIDVTIGVPEPPHAATGSRAAVSGEAARSTRAGVQPAAAGGPARPKAPRFLAALVLVLLLAAAGTLLLRSRAAPSPTRPARPQPALPAPGVTPPSEAATEALSAQPTLAPPAEPTEAPLAPAPAPAAAAELKLQRSSAEEARGRAARSRVAAERARAGELAKITFDQARLKEREAQRLLDQGNTAAAKMAFELASQLFESAEMAASNTAALKSRREAEAAAALQPSPASIREPEPVRPTAVQAAEPTRLPATAVPAPRAPSEPERIAETLRAYEKAQSTLDVDLYARVYAGLTAERRQQVLQAWQGLRSQDVKLECQPAKIAGASADVTCFEQRVAVPRVGTEQRNDTSRSLHLEKRGDAWVITSMK